MTTAPRGGQIGPRFSPTPAVEIAGRSAARVAAVGWGLGVVGLVVTSATAFELLHGLGADGLTTRCSTIGCA